MAVKRLTIMISGRVQGVSFRYYAKSQADCLGLAGFVRNQADGTVLVEAEGEEAELRRLLAWCRRGPAGARVTMVEPVFSDELPGYRDFRIAP